MAKAIFVFFLLAFLTLVSEKTYGNLTAENCKNIKDPYIVGACTGNGAIDYDCVYKKCHKCCKNHG